MNLFFGKSFGKIYGRIVLRFWLLGILFFSESFVGIFILLGFLLGINILVVKILLSGIFLRIWFLFYKGM